MVKIVEPPELSGQTEKLLNIQQAVLEITHDQLLGDGNYSNVYSARYQNNIYAFKRLKQKKSKKDRFNSALSSEIYSLTSLQHQHIIGLYAVVKNKEKISGLLFEYANQGTLTHRLTQDINPIDYKSAVTFSSEILSALYFMHSKGAVHRDVKPDNIFFHDGKIKLGDFGYTLFFNDFQIDKDDPFIPSYIVLPAHVKATPLYAAIEVYDNCEISSAGDMYSFALILFQMLSGKACWEEVKSGCVIFEEKRNGQLPGILPVDTPLILEHIIRQCVDTEPANRLTAKAALEQLPKEEILKTTTWMTPSRKHQALISSTAAFFKSRIEMESDGLTLDEISLFTDIVNLYPLANKPRMGLSVAANALSNEIEELYSDFSNYVDAWKKEVQQYRSTFPPKWIPSDLNMNSIMNRVKNIPACFIENSVLELCLLFVETLELYRDNQFKLQESEALKKSPDEHKMLLNECEERLQTLNKKIIFNQQQGSYMVRDLIVCRATKEEFRWARNLTEHVFGKGEYLLKTVKGGPLSILPSYHSLMPIKAMELIAENVICFSLKGRNQLQSSIGLCRKKIETQSCAKSNTPSCV